LLRDLHSVNGRQSDIQDHDVRQALLAFRKAVFAV
jgi:hypothetical protein